MYEEEHAARTAIKNISLEVAAAETAAMRAAEARKAAAALAENGRLELQALAEMQAEIARLTGFLQDPSGGDLILAEWNGARPPALPSFGSLAPSGPLGSPGEGAKSPAPLVNGPEVMPCGLLTRLPVPNPSLSALCLQARIFMESLAFDWLVLCTSCYFPAIRTLKLGEGSSSACHGRLHVVKGSNCRRVPRKIFTLRLALHVFT